MLRCRLPVLLLSLTLLHASAWAREIAGLELVTGDPSAESVVARLEHANATADIEVLAKYSEVNLVTGFEYTLVKAHVGGEDVTATLNEATGAFALDADLPEREAREMLAGLPPVYRRMGPDLLAQIREEQGGRLGASAAGAGRTFDVTFYADSAAALDAIEGALGKLAEDRFDAVRIYQEQTAALADKSSLPPAPQIRSIRAKAPLATILEVGSLEAVAWIEPTAFALARLDVSVPRVGGDVLRGYGLDGTTGKVAIVDSGVDDGHPSLPLIPAADEADFTGSTGVPPTDDFNGHGTHVAGIVRSANVIDRGMAVGAPLVNAKSLGATRIGDTVDTPGGGASQIAAGLVFSAGRSARVINGSYGFAGCTAPGMCRRDGMCSAPAGSFGNACEGPADCGAGGVCVITRSCTAPAASVGRPCIADAQCNNPAGGVCGPSSRTCTNNAACDIAGGGGAGECVLAGACSAPAANVRNPCILNRDCDTAAGSGDGRCRDYTLRPCAANANCDYPAAAGNGTCSTPTSNGSGRAARDVDDQVYDNNITVAIAAEESGYHGRCSGGAQNGNACNWPEQCTGGTCIPRSSSPNDGFNIITVGSTDVGNNPSVVSSFSMIGPTVDLRSKPDVVAPGNANRCDGGNSNGAACPAAGCRSSNAAVVGCTPALSGVCDDGVTACTRDAQCPGGSLCYCNCDAIDSCNNNWEGVNPDFVDKAGTSMATPHVSGLASLLWDFGSTKGVLTDTPYLKAAILNNANRLAGWTRPSISQPLDTAQGTGEISSTESFRAYADDLRVWQQRATGTAAKDSHWYWLDVTGTPTPVVPTLVFERHVTDPAAAAPSLNDLDLRLYSPTGVPLDRSISAVDSVEHIVYNATTNGRYCVEVDPFRLTQGPELYALAASRPPAGNVRDFRLNFLGNVNPCVPDFGDAPDLPYPTLLASNGARHLDWTKEWLGTSRPEIDGELKKKPLTVVSRVDPFPSVSGESDAIDPADQDGIINLTNTDGWDDGVVIPGPFLPGVPKTIFVTVQCTVDDTGVGPLGRYDAVIPTKRLYLNGWADWNGNGTWADPGEKILGTGSPTGQLAIDPASFGTNGRYTIGETYNDANGSGRWEPGETFVDSVGATQRTFSYVVVPPAFLAPDFYLRFRVDYGEDVGVVANVSGTLNQFVGAAQFGEVEDYRNRYEIDVFPVTTAQFDLRIPAASTTPTLIDLTGPSVVQVDLGAIGDTDGDGREQVPTQMTSLNLQGSSPTYGSIQVHLRDPAQDPFLTTTGEIEETTNVSNGVLDLPPFTTAPANLDADSFFNVSFEVVLPDQGLTLHSHAPKYMRSRIRNKPPKEGDVYYNPTFTLLYDASESVVAAVGPGYHIPNTPQRPPEIDILSESSADVDVHIPPGGPSQIVTLTGPSVVRVDLPAIADTDLDGLEQVTTEMLDLDLHGFLPGYGNMIVRERPASVHPFQATLGEIEENSNVAAGVLDLPPFTTVPPNLTASSYFNVYFEIELPDSGLLLHSHDPKHMSSVIRNKPPAPGDVYQNPEFIPLYDAFENHVADVGPGRHIPHPQPVVTGAGDITLLQVNKLGPQTLLSWLPSCDTTDSDYAVYVGQLPFFYTHNAFACSTGGATNFTVPPLTGSRYFLVVPRDGSFEGSYGKRSGGIERPQGAGACGTKQISCP